MYKLDYFTEKDNERVIQFMKDNPFAIITAVGEKYPVASHIPLDIISESGKMFFEGHIMRNTDHHKAFEKNENVLVIFNGPHCFVSASWYIGVPSASTWNYMTVHAKGKISFLDGEGTMRMIRSITDKYEGKESSAAFDNLAPEYINRLVKSIVGFRIEVESVDNVFKLSQNHEEETRQSIIEHLEKREDENSREIAEEMKKSKSVKKVVGDNP
jgi:transcriptional regulator